MRVWPNSLCVTKDIWKYLERVVRVVSLHSVDKASYWSGTQLVHWINWSDFLQNYFKTIPNFTSYHHFKVSKSEPGTVVVKEYADSPGKAINISKKDINESSLMGKKPEEIIPAGLDAKWQWYLYDEIQPFCSNNLAKDMTCPKPSVPRPNNAPQEKRRRKATNWRPRTFLIN